MITKSRSLVICMAIILVLGLLYITSSILSHNAEDLQCTCMLCINNRLPKNGEYLYNHYLFVLSFIWIAFLVILGYVVMGQTESNERKTNKKRNR